MIDECLDRSLTSDEVNIQKVCAAILPNDNQTDCISVKNYTKEPDPQPKINSEGKSFKIFAKRIS